MGREAFVKGLSPKLDGAEWASQDMAQRVNRYVLGLAGKAGGSLALRLSPLFKFGVDFTDGLSAMAQLRALNDLDPNDISTAITEAWTRSNGEPPKGDHAGYRHFIGEVLLQVKQRIRLDSSNG